MKNSNIELMNLIYSWSNKYFDGTASNRTCHCMNEWMKLRLRAVKIYDLSNKLKSANFSKFWLNLDLAEPVKLVITYIVIFNMLGCSWCTFQLYTGSDKLYKYFKLFFFSKHLLKHCFMLFLFSLRIKVLHRLI